MFGHRSTLPLLKRVYQFIKRTQERMLDRKRQEDAEKRIAFFEPPYMLHVGCGHNRFDGWLNIDLNDNLDTVDISWDASKRFPFDDGSCTLIYSEHFLEHLTVEQASTFLSECYRLLRPGGTLRIATPSLSEIIQKYNSGDWRNQDWLTKSEYQFIETGAEMVNIAFRWWGHKWLYDREELRRRLHDAGFGEVTDVGWGKSNVPDLRNRETRKDSLLICEAWK